MLKKSIGYFAVIASLLTTSAFASNELQQTNNTVAGPYTDLTGTWVGSCTNGRPSTLTIQNTSDRITVDGDNRVIGKLETFSDTSSNYSHLSQTLFHWNADGSQLILNIAVEDQSFNSEIEDKDFFVGKVIYTRSQNQLIVDTTYQSLANKENVVCTYNKQQ